MNKTQLMEIVSSLGVEGVSSSSLKADMIAAIMEVL